jgi:hypothetical protein
MGCNFGLENLGNFVFAVAIAHVGNGEVAARIYL